MIPASSLSQSPLRADIPLANLFAYIRDVFSPAHPQLNILEAPETKVWSFGELSLLAEQLPDQVLIHWPKGKPQLPLVKLSRAAYPLSPVLPPSLQNWVHMGEEVAGIPQLQVRDRYTETFEAEETRVQLFAEFAPQIQGKAIEEVGNLSIPAPLEAWITFDEQEGKVQVSCLPEREIQLEPDSPIAQQINAFQETFERYVAQCQAIQTQHKWYDQWHEAFYTCQAEVEVELSLTFGWVHGTIGGKAYSHPLFWLPLQLELNHHQLLVQIPEGSHVSCEQHLAELLDQHFSSESATVCRQRRLSLLQTLEQLQQEFTELSLEEALQESRLQTAARSMLAIFPHVQLLPEGQAFDEHKSGIQLSLSPHLILRKKPAKATIARDAERIAALIPQLIQQGETELVPDFFKKLFSLRRSGNPLRVAYKAQDQVVDTPIRHMEPQPQRWLFPLPYNQEQLSIAQRLLEQDAVTVQGPPGTGKSHTITNLLSHFVAEGKSMLVVSKNPKALAVLRDKLPAPLRSLAISLLSGVQAQDELKYAIDAIKHQLSLEYDPARLLDMERHLTQLEQEQDQLMTDLLQSIHMSYQELELYDPGKGKIESLLPQAWMDRWKEYRQGPVQINDSLSPEVDIPNLSHTLHRYLSKAAEVDLSLAHLRLPENGVFPSPSQVQLALQKREIPAKQLILTRYQRISAELVTEALLAEIEESVVLWNAYRTHSPLFLACLEEPAPLQRWLEAHQAMIAQLKAATRKLDHHRFEGEALGEGAEKLLPRWEELMVKFGQQNELPLLKRKLLSRTHKALLAIQINGKAAESREQLQLLGKYLTWQLADQQIRKAIGSTEGFAEHWSSEEALLPQIESWEQSLQTAETLRQAAQTWKDSGILPADLLLQEESTWTYLQGLTTYRTYLLADQAWQQLVRPTLPFRTVHPLLSQLVEALWTRNGKSYQQHYFGLQRLLLDARTARELQKQREQLREILPESLESLEAGELPELQAIEKALFCRKWERLVEDQRARQSGSALDKWKELQQEKETLTAEYIAYSAWMQRKEALTEEQIAAISAWRNDLINIGKGYGKNTQRNLDSAVQNLRLARKVVPIWIMPQEAALECFPDPEPGQFDLLIVDEASQCDVSAMNLIFRAKQCIIVGDENQTAVVTQPKDFPLERTNLLLDQYLPGHPFQQQFNLNNRSTSIYSLSGIIYPNIVSLREHFRCRPELIGFSNQEVYDDHIIPLRMPTHQHFGKAKEAHYLPDQGKKSAPQLVEAAVQFIESLIEDYQQGELPQLPTVGIICLESSNEAHRELLLQQLQRSRMIKAYQEEMELLVGSSREFQGDERDIILLTTTAQAKTDKQGNLRPPRAVMGEEMMRIYNVATSRAKEKMVLLHSLPEELVAKMKPTCFRKKLIEYLSEEQLPEQSLIKWPPATDPRMPLIRELQEQFPEAQLIPDFQLGPYQLDLAILQEDTRKALFFDGHQAQSEAELAESLQLQLLLERVGWETERISPW
ncbi:MAG: AAA family ATPase [Bacteroidota bacterium]